jgi:hypothetical protein
MMLYLGFFSAWLIFCVMKFSNLLKALGLKLMLSPLTLTFTEVSTFTRLAGGPGKAGGEASAGCGGSILGVVHFGFASWPQAICLQKIAGLNFEKLQTLGKVYKKISHESSFYFLL